MRKIMLLSILSAALLVPLVYAGAAQAQATRTWVSGVGDDVNPCSRTAPCKTFAGAISKTAQNGEINCLDPGGFGAVTITKSITIDCHEVFASILASGVNGVIINVTGAGDSLKTVRLRNINISGSGGGARTGLNGVRILAATAVYFEDGLIGDFTLRGISDERTTGGDLFVSNSTFRTNGGAGIAVSPSAGAVKIDATISNVLSEGNLFGVAIGSGARAIVKASVLSGNTNAGLEVEGPAGASEANADGCTITGNGTGLQQVAGGTIRVSNSDIAFNATGIQGTVNSFTNNRFSNNGAGGTITPIGGPSNSTGQQ